MVKLKKSITIIDSEIKTNKKHINIIKILSILTFVLIILISTYLGCKHMKPYINATDINKIVGKKIFLTECNTKDYITISKDKSFSLSLTNELCEKEYYEGDITIKDNIVIFTDSIKGKINNDYNIIINNNIFVSDKNE